MAARYITPTLTITSNSYDATKNPGPVSSPLNISISDDISVTEMESKVVDASTTATVLFDASEYAVDGDTAGTDGGFVYVRNLITSTSNHTDSADIYIGFGASAEIEDGGGGEATRLMTLKQGEFSFFSWDMENDLIVDASAAVSGALEAIMFSRSTTS